MKFTKSNTAKIAAGLVGFAFAFSLLVTPVTAGAQTTAELQAMINTLLAQIAALQGQVGSTSTSHTFTADLTVGSRGDDVTALQTWLVSKGFLTMPAGTSMGYFGNATKAAVAAFQASKGISATGFVGPLTRAALNSMTVVSTGTDMCANISGVQTTVPTGMTRDAAGNCSNTTVGNGTDGSITISYSPYVTSSQTLKKGDNKDIYAVKLQATSGAVNVNRFDVHFSERPWLDFAQLQLHDSNGNVIATKTLSSSADATEVTVGSDYLVRFDNVNYTVTPGTDSILIVKAMVQAASDKITGQTVTVSLPSGSIRTINGLGYTDSLGFSSGSTNSVTLSSTGSTGDIYTRISPNTPDQRIVTTSVSQTTNDVVLGTFSVKSQNQNSTINGLTFTVNGLGIDAAHTYQNMRIRVGGTTYGANALATTTTFTNLTIPLAQDQWTDMTLMADVKSGITGATSSSTIVASGIVGVDANFNTLTVSNASNATANTVSLQTAGISISNMSASYTLTTGGANGNTTGAAVTFAFTVTNTGNSDIFLSKVPGVALSTSTTGSVGSPVTASSTITYVQSSPSSLAADTGTAPSSGAYVVPAGNSRTFTYTGSLDNTNGTAGIRVFKITAINFGTTAAAPTGSSINFNLDPLTVTPVLAAN